MRGRWALALGCLLTAGCGGSASTSKEDSEKVVKQWVTAAVEQDGAGYCKALSKDLLEKVTGAQSDKAKTKCEDLVKRRSTKLPLLVAVQPGRATKSSAQATVSVTAPKGPVTLLKEDGELKIDKVGPPSRTSAPPKPKKPPKKRRKKKAAR